MSIPKHKTFEHFKYKSLDDIIQAFKALELDIPFSQNTESLKQPISIQNLILPNRLAIQPMEGYDASDNGAPSDLSERRYMRYANSGVGLIWFESTAISLEGKSNKNQLLLTEKNLEGYKQVVQKVKQIGRETLKSLGFDGSPILIIQLNHSGRYSKSGDMRIPIRAFSNKELDAAIGINESDGIIATDEQLEDIEELWVKKALLAKEAGFDGVDIKACHGYLNAGLLSARTRENSGFGGKPIENRARLLLNIVSKLREKISKDDNFIVTSRLGVYDGISYPNGFGVEENENFEFPAPPNINEPLWVIKNLYKNGVRLINITMGNPYYKPHLTRPYNQPAKGGTLPDEHPLYSLYRHYNTVRQLKEQLPSDLVVLGSAFSYLQKFAGYITAGLVENEWVDICGFGRMAFANPEFPKQIFIDGKIDPKKTCIACSKCSELMRAGKSSGCVIRDSETYAKYLK